MKRAPSVPEAANAKAYVPLRNQPCGGAGVTVTVEPFAANASVVIPARPRSNPSLSHFRG
jgi:hypothetical protein